MNSTRALALIALSLLAAGCPGETKLVLPNPPTIDKFTATPASVMKGGMVNLEWTTRDGDVEVIHVGLGPVAGVDRNAHDGSVMVQVDAPSLFVLNVTNQRGVKVTALTTVTVEGAAQQVMFAALPSVVAPGGSSSLVWTAPGARAVSITPMGGAPLDLRGQVETGSVQVSPSAATRYTLDADGTTKTVDVSLTQAVISFTASKSVAPAGEMVTLAWKTSNATKITLTQPGKGVVASETDPAKVADGSAIDTLADYAKGTVVPYLLTVEGAGDPLTRTVAVVVGTDPKVLTFTGPDYAKSGQKFTLSWTTANADAVELAAGGTVFYRTVAPAQAAAGSLLLDTPAAMTDYTIFAINTSASARDSKTWSQKIVGPASITTFTALPATVANGGDAVTLTWNVPNARHLRVTDSDGVTVASARGATAETGTQVAYPNGATTYTLTADNTLDAPVTTDAGVTVTTPAPFGATGTLLANAPFDVTWTVGGTAPLQGNASAQLSVQAASTGFVDISTTGTKLNFTSTDDAVIQFTPVDFETFLWGTRVTGTFTASTNGFIALVPTAATRATPIAMPNGTIERNFLAAWWLDLTLGTTGAVYWQVLGEAPERTLVVQYDHVSAKAATGSDLVFEIKVHQTGLVTYEYKTLANLGSAIPIVGAQGPPNNARVAGAPSAGSSTTFFGPTPSPLSVTASAPDPISGFIKLSNGYLRPTFTPGVFVQPNQIGVTEVLYSPNPAIATTGEWVEITNRSTANIDLAGWTLDFGLAGTLIIDAGMPLPAGGTVIVGQTERDAGNDNVPVSFVYGPQYQLSDDAGSVSLYLGGYRSDMRWNTADGGPGGVGVSEAVDYVSGHLSIGDTATTPLHPITCTSRENFGTQTPQQKGSPGASAVCIARKQSIPVSYFDISGTGTALFTSFDTSTAAISFTSAPFPFAGASITTGSVSTNGFVTLKANTSSATTNKTAPDTVAPSGTLLAVFWDDLDRNTAFTGSNGYFKRIAPNEDPQNPGGHWIVQWHHYSHFVAADNLNFQIKLFDTGVIEYHYATMVSGSTSNYANGNSATVWLENVAGTSALISSINQAVVVPNSAIRFTP